MARRLLGLAAAIGLLVGATPAFGSDANMSEIWSFGKKVGLVTYTEAPSQGEPNDVTISMPSPTKVTIKDPGAYIWSGWGVLMGYGCTTSNVSEPDGSFPATCQHPNGIGGINLGLGNAFDFNPPADRLSVAPSAASLAVSVDTGFARSEIDLHDGTGNDSVACGYFIQWVWLDPGDTSSGCETASLGGQLVGGPAVASWGPGHLDVFWRGAAGDLRWKQYDNGWSSELSLGGQLTSDPAAVSWGPGRIDVFWRGAAGELRHNWFRNWGWQGEESLGGQLAAGSGPAVSSWGLDRLDVFWRGTANDLRHRWYDKGWYWEESLGGSLTSDPDAVSWGPDRIDIFARGSANELRHRWWDWGWSPWESLGGVLTSGPAAASRGTNSLDIFFKGTDGALYRRAYDSGWSGFTRLGGRLTSDPAAVSLGNGRVDVFMRSPYSDLFELWLIP
jgi:hypothetical protein